MKRTNRMISILLAVVMVACMLPVSVFATETCTCENRCYLDQIDANCTVCTNSDFSGCMGTPELMENGSPIRLSETEAEVYFMGTVNPNVTWKYFYIVTNDATVQPTASEIIASGASGDYSDPCTLVLNNLAEGEKYIHIVLNQEEQGRTTNVLRLTIPAFVKLTLTPSANGGNYDAATNTLTIAGGGTVNFTLNMPGYVHCDSDDTIEATPLGDDPENATEWTVTLPATPNTYTFYYGLGGQEAWCTVVVVEETTHQHKYFSSWSKDASGHWHDCDCGATTDYAKHTSSGAASYGIPETCTVCKYEIAPAKTGYTLTLDYSIVTESGVEIGTGISNQIVGCPAGDVVDLSGYWRGDSLEVTGSDGKTYYFGGFVENSNGNGILLYSATMNSNKTLYANWVFDKQITVILDTQSGTLPYRKVRIAEKYAEISEMNSLHKPVRAGYDFAGWSVEDDGVADSGDTYISDGWPIYAVWQTYMPSYDDNWDPPAPGTPVEIGGDYDAVRISDGVIDKIIDNGNEVVVKFPDGTSGTLTDSALVAAKENLQDGESLQIAIKNAGSEVLPDSLTEQGPYGGSDAAIDKSIFKATGIENIEDRLKTLGLINGNTDSSVTEDEFEYLYHYLTTDELTALKNELNESAHFEHHQNAVNWLTKMIERDGAQVALNTGHLDESGIRSKLEAVGYTGNGLPLGLLRQADLDMEQLEYIRNLMQEFIEVFDDDADELILAWANEAIAKKEFEATCVQMNALLEEARNTQGSYTGLNDVKAAVKDMTTYELKLFLKKANAAKNTESGTIPVLALGAIDSIIKVLNSELEARGTNDVPTYVQVGGTFDGINPIFIGAVDVNIGAVKADGTTTPIAIKADRSDAVAWSTNIGSAALEEMLAMLGAATTEDVVSNIKAYKVLDNGTLEAKASKVAVNADGTLTLSAMSDGNSTYVFLYEPAKLAEEHPHTFEWKIDKEATDTEDGIKHEECACGEKRNENTVIPKTGSGEPVQTQPKESPSTGWIIAIIAAAVAVIGGGAAWVIYRKKRRTN